jgi:ElaB/YqjD/DUF883 family membrane-anchored ribosome-binding protein
MADQTSSSTSDSEFQTFSRRADQEAPHDASEATRRGDDRSGELAANLKEFGIDTDRMAEAANEHVSDLQQMMIDEVRARPLRAVCWAATAGLVVGLLWAR